MPDMQSGVLRANTSNNLLTTIEERMQQAATATELVKQHRETLESKIEEVKRQAQKVCLLSSALSTCQYASTSCTCLAPLHMSPQECFIICNARAQTVAPWALCAEVCDAV
jgi:hypothetical protein